MNYPLAIMIIASFLFVSASLGFVIGKFLPMGLRFVFVVLIALSLSTGYMVFIWCIIKSL